MVPSCAEPLALPSRSPVCSSLSGPPRLSSARRPEAQSLADSPPPGPRPRLKHSDRSIQKGAAAEPYAPGQMRPFMVSPTRIASRWRGSDGIPPGCNQYFHHFAVELAASVPLPEPLSPPDTIQTLSGDLKRGNPAFPSPRLSKAGRKGRL